MSYQISGDKLGNTHLKELLKKLANCFDSIKLPFYVIGATARDIVMRQMLDTVSSRRTQDLDIAIAISDWSMFERVAEILVTNGLKRSRHVKQRFFMGDYELDIVPFGAIARSDNNIYWPPEEEIAMSVRGFGEVLNDAITVRVDNEFNIKIASLYGLFLLKFNAWVDRHQRTSKDAEDMFFIIENYFNANLDRQIHLEVFELKDFDVNVVGGIWLAYDIVSLLNVELIVYYRDKILEEINKEESSILINQILEHNTGLKYELLIRIWREMIDIFNKEIEQRKMKISNVK